MADSVIGEHIVSGPVSPLGPARDASILLGNEPEISLESHDLSACRNQSGLTLCRHADHSFVVRDDSPPVCERHSKPRFFSDSR